MQNELTICLVKTVKIFHLDYDNADFATPVSRIQEFLSPHTIEYVNPESGLIDGIYSHTRHDYLVPDCLVDLVTGLVFVDDGLIAESSPWPEANLHQSLSRYQRLFSFRKYKAPTSQLMNVIPSAGFYHWLIEQLPIVVHQWRSTGEDLEFAVYEEAPKYVLDLVTLLNLKVKVMPRFVKFPHFMMTSFAPTTGWPSRKEVSIIRSLVPEKSKVPNEEINVYVSRRKASRSPRFEERLQNDLASLGWRVIHNEDLTLQEQIQTYNQARRIVGVHGAGLASQVWMKQKSKVIELSPFSTRNCMAVLASELENDFNRLKFGQAEMRSNSTHDHLLNKILSTLYK